MATGTRFYVGRWDGEKISSHIFGGNEEQVQNFRQIGSDLGMAFQVIDDVLDLRKMTEIGVPGGAHGAGLGAPADSAGTKAPRLVITMEKGGDITLELFPKDAPKHVEKVASGSLIPFSVPATFAV